MVPSETIYSTNTFAGYDLHMKTAGRAKTHRPDDDPSASDRPRGAAWPGGVAPAPLDGIGTTPESSVPFRSVGFTVSTIGYAVSRRFREILAPLELEPREFA